MSSFESWTRAASIEVDAGHMGAATVHIVSALKALAAERAAERERAAEFPRCMPFGTKCASNCTAAFVGPCGRAAKRSAALDALAQSVAGAPGWEETMRAQTLRYGAQGNPPFRIAMDGRGYCVARETKCLDGCSEAAGYCLATKRAAALSALALNDAEEVCPSNIATATARVAMARDAAPEPVSVGQWGMH